MDAVLKIAKKNLPLLIGLGFIDIFIELLERLEPYDQELQHRIVNNILSIARSSPENRDALNNKEIHLSICSIVETSADDVLLAACIRTLSVLISDQSPPEMWRSVAAAINRVLQIAIDDDLPITLNSALKLIRALTEQESYEDYPLEIVTPDIVSSLTNLVLTEAKYGVERLLEVIGDLVDGPIELKHLFIDAGIIPNLLTLQKSHRCQILLILSTIADEPRPSDIDAFLDDNAHIFLFNVINDRTFEVLACGAIFNVLQASDHDNFHRLANAPMFFKTFKDNPQLLAFAPCLFDRLLDYGQRLGQIQSGFFDPEIPCGTAPNNPILDYLYVICGGMVDDAGEPRSAHFAYIAEMLKYVGNGHRPS